jgi:hypothetical protein
MNPHFEEIIDLYDKHQIDVQKMLYWHLSFGLVVSDPDCFALCFFCRSSDPTSACQIHESDTLFVTVFTGDMGKALERYKDRFGFVAFQREFNNSPRVRVYDMQKFHSKLN